MTSPLRTERLELIAATREILLADLNDRHELGRLLHAEIPPSWPPPLLDENVLREFLRMSDDTGGPVFSTWYWVRDDPLTGRRILIGNGGILPSGSDPSSVVLGYSVLEEFQNQGYATEAVRSLIPDIFSRPDTCSIIATTYPELGASIRVLEKSGFVKTDPVISGSGAEEGTVCYRIEKR